MSDIEILAGVLQIADGEIVGRVRLQKVFFLLDQLGMNSEFNYEYHHFGPYSDELMDCVYFSSREHIITERFAHRVGDGARYSIFCLERAPESPPKKLGNIPADQARSYIRRFKSEDATVLELAATIVWLREVERYDEWEVELRYRKAAKVTHGRVDKAKKLLSDIGLAA